jgi:glycosyltransferase involved in cell wall biosynthesis
MRILIVSDAWKPQLNGVVRTYEYLAAELAALGHEVKIVGPHDFPLRMPLPGYREIELALLPYRRLARMIDAFAPDTIHIGTEATLGKAARAYCLRRGRVFTTAYHTHFPDYAAKRAAKFLPFLARPVHALFTASLRNFHNCSGAVMVATESLAAQLRASGFTAPFYPLTRGVDAALFTPEPREAALYAALAKPVALYVGRVAIEKNIGDFLAMAWPGGKAVVGDGPALEELRGKYPQALFAGRRTGEDLARHYRNADIFVFPSRTDTFGMVLVEAMACGLPIAGYDVTGPKDIVTAPFLGATDADDLARAAQKALEVAAEGRQARHDYARAHYSWRLAAEQFVAASAEAEAKARRDRPAGR